MPRSVSTIDFVLDDFSAVLAEAQQIGRDRDGWINVRPLAPDDADSEQLTEFSPTPPVAPVGLFARWRLILIQGTWIPGKIGRNGVEDAQVGLQHPAGRFAVRQLRDAGCPVPDGWRVVVDHAKRGLVLSVPDGEGGAAGNAEAILRWLPAAGSALAPQQVTGAWRAEVHHRR
jgi:hypothetical protein